MPEILGGWPLGFSLNWWTFFHNRHPCSFLSPLRKSVMPDVRVPIGPIPIGCCLFHCTSLLWQHSWCVGAEDGQQGVCTEVLLRLWRRFWRVFRIRGDQKHSLMFSTIQHLLELKAIEPVPTGQSHSGVCSIFFLVPKKNGDVRSILYLKWWNRFLKSAFLNWRC